MLQSARDLEPVSVVLDLQLDTATARSQEHVDRRRIAVLTDVRERLLEDADERDSLRLRHPPEISDHPCPDLHPGALGQRVDLGVDHALQGTAQEACRLERMRELAQYAVELSEAALDPVELRPEGGGQPRPEVT